MTSAWSLPEDLSAASFARQRVAEQLAGQGLPDATVDDLVLIASELVANAVRHGSPPAVLTLEVGPDRIRILVSNHGSAPDPRVLTADPDADHGRGLAMVEALADEVGWARDGERLDVWAEVHRHA